MARSGTENKMPTRGPRRSNFDDIYWHDSKLMSFSLTLQPDLQTADVVMGLNMLVDPRPGHARYQDAKLQFKDCRVFRSDLNVVAKAMVSHDLAFAESTVLSPDEAVPGFENSLVQDAGHVFIRFHFEFIPPGGTIDFLARTWELIYTANGAAAWP